MKATATILTLFLLAGSASAQSNAATRDYSKDTLLRLFIEAGDEDDDSPIHYRDGAVRFNALGTSWRFNYLPMAAMHGTLTGVTLEPPNPFLLTGTQIATSPRNWRTRREVNAELRRIEATERARVRVTVKAD